MDISVNCINAENNAKHLTVKITNSSFRGAKIRKAFKDSLNTIKFCRIESISSKYKRGEYTLLATVVHPFKFPVKTLHKNFETSLNGIIFRSYNIEFETEVKAQCLIQHIECLLEDYNIKCLKIKNKVNVRCSCVRAHISHIKKIIKQSVEKIQDRPNWCLRVNNISTEAIPNILQLIGWPGDYKIYNDFVFIYLSDADLARTLIEKYNNALKEISNHQPNCLALRFRLDDKFLAQYNGRIILSGNGIYITHFNYDWIITNTTLTHNRINDTVNTTAQLAIDYPNNPRGIIKALIYKAEYTDLIKLSFFLKDYTTFINDNSELVCIDFFPNQEEPLNILKKFEKEKNSWSLIRYDDVFLDADVEKINSAIRNYRSNFELQKINYITMSRELTAIISNCGPATCRRISKTLEQLCAQDKTEFLKNNEADDIEIFSQDTLAEIPADRIKYIIRIDNCYYDAKKLQEIVLSTDNPTIPHNRRPMVESDYILIINALS